MYNPMQMMMEFYQQAYVNQMTMYNMSMEYWRAWEQMMTGQLSQTPMEFNANADMPTPFGMMSSFYQSNPFLTPFTTGQEKVVNP